MKSNIRYFLLFFALICGVNSCMEPVKEEPVNIIGKWHGSLSWDNAPDTKWEADLTVAEQQENNFRGEALIQNANYTITGTLKQREITAQLVTCVPESEAKIYINASGELIQDDYIEGSWNDGGTIVGGGIIIYGKFKYTKDE